MATQFQKYKLGTAGIGAMLGLSMSITLFFPSWDFRSGESTWVGLDKTLSNGRVIGFSYEDPLVIGEGKPITVELTKDPMTGAPIDPPMRAYVYKAGVPMSAGVRHTANMGPTVGTLSVERGKVDQAKDGDAVVFTIGRTEVNGEEWFYAENATVTKGWTTDAVLSAASPENIRYVGRGKTVYITEGCWWCHTLLPEETQDWQVFGAPPFLGDFNGEMPTAFGSDRKAPDILHVASRNSSKEWMTMHFFNPRLVQPNSIMPRFDYLWGKTDASGKAIDFDKWRADYKDYRSGKTVYPPEVPSIHPDSEVRALIDWVLTSLK
ncbi:MAG: cbb3-type cytochrome c oxidase subunit II [Thiohalomonadales bacterium]